MEISETKPLKVEVEVEAENEVKEGPLNGTDSATMEDELKAAKAKLIAKIEQTLS